MAEKIKKLPEKTESEILFPGVQVNKYTVEPWGLVEIGKVAPVIARIISTCKEKDVKITSDNLAKDILSAMPFITDDIFEICGITVGVSAEEIKNITPRIDTITMTLTIVSQNVEYLKNLPGLIGSMLKTIRG